MPKLVLSMDGLVLKEMALEKERTTIGRKRDNDIQIDNLAVSGHHAVITCILDDAFLEDLNSTNGTYVNGQMVKKQVLRDNDVIELGKYRIKFITDSSAGRISAAARAEQPALKPFQLPDPAAPVAPPPPPVSAPTERLGVIQVLSGANAGRELELSKSMTTLGKTGRQVAVITRRPHGYFITHVEGATFPLVNGKPIDAQARHLLDHDIIELAGVKMAFLLRD